MQTKMADSYHTQLKKNYEQRCREVDAADEAFKKSVSLASKDEEKVMKLKWSYRLYRHYQRLKKSFWYPVYERQLTSLQVMF